MGPMKETLHRRSIVIDSLVISKWDRAVFADMRKAGFTASTLTH